MSMPAEVIETPQQAARRLADTAIAQGHKPEALHEYADADGKPLYWRIRCKHTDGRKWIRPMHWNGKGYALGEPPAPEEGRPLYRLPELLAADAETMVYVVEGEQCANALHKLGLLATTSGSSSSADGADWTPLQGRTVCLWPDNDAPGYKYMDAVSEHLHALGCNVCMVSADLVKAPPEHGDCVDFLEANPDADIADLPTENLNPSKTGGDIGDAGDSPACGGSRVPTDRGQAGDFGDVVGLKATPDGTPLPYFLVNDTGVSFVDSDGTDHQPSVWICSPLHVAALTRDTQNSEWGRLLVFHDADGNEHRWACPQSLHAGKGDELRATLLREGLTISANHKARQKLGDYIQRAAPDIRARCVTRTGWHGDVFALPRETYGDANTEPVLFQGVNMDGVTLARSGDLQAWAENVAKPCAGNSRLVLAVCMGFAGPCLSLIQAEGGGIHLRGPSTSGKSTAQHMAASIYGHPKEYKRSWRATDNGLEGTCALHSDLLLVLDELGQLDAKHAGQVAYLVANGQGKARSARDGSPRGIAMWNVLFLSSGEIGLGDLVSQSGGRVRAGQQVRVVDIPAEAGAGLGLFDTVPDGMAPGTFADNLNDAAAKHYGTALPAFLNALTANPENNRDTLQALRTDIAESLTPDDAPGQVRRVADRFALIGAAGELATVLNLTGWNTGEAEQAAAQCFRDWLDARDTTGNAEPAAMLAQVRTFLEAHGEARFTPWDADNPRTINRAGYRRDNTDGPTYYIEAGAFRNEVCKGFDHRAVSQVLADHDALEQGGDGRKTCKKLLPDGRRARVYVVLPTLWGEQ